MLLNGAVIVPLNPTLTPDDLAYILDVVQPARIVATPRTVGLASGLSVRTHVVDAVGAELVLDGTAPRGGDGLHVELRETDPFCVTFTSGSTAYPKGVVHTVGSLFGNAATFADHTGLGPASRFLHLLPISYMAGLLNLLVSPFMAGASVVIGPEFSARRALDFWSVPSRHEVNSFWLTPTIVAMLLRLDRDVRPTGTIASLRHAFVGTAALPSESKEAFETRYRFQLSPSYGTSELLIVTVNDGGHGRQDSVGGPLPGVELRLVDESGGIGEVFVRTPHRFAGYLGETPPSDDGGWRATGDVGTLLSDGQLVLTGRKKELIICGGINVSPVAVERVVGAHPAVDAVAAVGIPDPILGEVVAVAVRLREGLKLDEVRVALADHARARLAPAQRPAHWVQLAELPVTSIGKVQRLRVRDELIRLLRT